MVHRHFSCSILVSIQDGKFLGPVLRSNLSGIIFFRNENKIREAFIREEYLSFLNVKEFQILMKRIFQKFGDTMYLNNRAHPIKIYRNFSELTITGYESEIK